MCVIVCLLQTRREFCKQPPSWWFRITWFKIQLLLKESLGAELTDVCFKFKAVRQQQQDKDVNIQKLFSSYLALDGFQKTVPHPKAWQAMNCPPAGPLHGKTESNDKTHVL